MRRATHWAFAPLHREQLATEHSSIQHAKRVILEESLSQSQSQKQKHKTEAKQKRRERGARDAEA